jgi:PAS domain S-box-containing protein
VTLRTKLLLAQSPLAAALIVVGIAALVTIAKLGEHSAGILKDNYRSVLAAQRMMQSIERINGAALHRLMGRQDATTREAAAQRRRFETELQVQEGNITEPGEKEGTERLRALWSEYQRLLGELDRPGSGQDDYFARLEPKAGEVKAAAEVILALNQDAMVRKADTARRSGERMNTAMLIAALLALCGGLWATSALVQRSLRPLGVLAQVVDRVGEGDLGARASVPGSDEIARLAAKFNQMADSLQSYRKSSLGELLQAQRSSQAAIDSLPDAVVVLDIQGKVMSLNRAAESLLGLSADRLLDSPVAGDIDPALRSVLERVRGHVLGGKGPYVPRGYEEAVPFPSPEGPRYVLPRANPVYAEEGGIVGVTVVLQDITRMRRFDELKNDLVATVAHELRTPLTSLSMAIHLCTEGAVGDLNDKQADLLFAAREDCERLQSIVEDLLDLARIQAGRLERRRISPATLVETAVASHRAAAEDHRIELSTDLATPMTDIFVDPERLQLVLTNLLNNSIRHTPAQGKIVVRGDERNGHLHLEVSDSGEGIPAEHRGKVFQKFFRVPGSKAGAVGLGLAICKEIVEAHGGTIGLGEHAGPGTTIWIDLPRAPGEAPT